MHIPCKNVRVHFPDVHVMHCFHQSFRRAGRKALFSFADEGKKRKNNLVNFPRLLFSSGRQSCILYSSIYSTCCTLVSKNIKNTTSQYQLNVQSFAFWSRVWQLSVSNYPLFVPDSTCLDFCVIQMLLVRKENKCMPCNMTQNWLKSWEESIFKEDYNISYQIIIIACIGVSGSGVPQWDTLEDETGRLMLHLYEFGVNRLHTKAKKWVTHCAFPKIRSISPTAIDEQHSVFLHQLSFALTFHWWA